jgi:hypothetical protein
MYIALTTQAMHVEEAPPATAGAHEVDRSCSRSSSALSKVAIFMAMLTYQ